VAGLNAVPDVRAAGGVVWRVNGPSVEVLVVHRPRYRDWTFPKGKAEPGEADAACALREVQEETGFACVAGRELPASEYRDRNGRHKRVRYWEMAVAGGAFAPNTEVDQARWVDLDTARGQLTYPRDREVLDAFRALARP